jgi:hypothetical protein
MFNMSPCGDSKDVDSRTRSTDPGDGPGLPVRFATHKQPGSSNFLYQSQMSVGGSVQYLVRKPRCTVTIDWVLANWWTLKAFCSPENAMFAHHCLLAEKRITTPSHLSRKNFYISSIRWHAFVSYKWVCYCTAKPLNPRWTYETRCTLRPVVMDVQVKSYGDIRICTWNS